MKILWILSNPLLLNKWRRLSKGQIVRECQARVSMWIDSGLTLQVLGEITK